MDPVTENSIKLECVDVHIEKNRIIDASCNIQDENCTKNEPIIHNFTLNNTESLEDNRPSPTTKLTFACDKCPYTTIRKYNFVQHVVIHQSPKERIKYNCKLCVFESIHKKSLTRHLLTHSRNRREVLNCDLCAYETKNESSLRRHSRVHRNEAVKRCRNTNSVLEK